MIGAADAVRHIGKQARQYRFSSEAIDKKSRCDFIEGETTDL